MPLCALAKVSGKVKTWLLHNVPPRAENLSRAGSSAAKAGLLSGGLVQHRRGRDRGTAKRRAAAVAGDGRPAAGPLGLPPSAEPADPHHPALNDPGGQRDGQQHRRYRCTAVATAHHLGHLLDEPTLARLCVALEPTDSTLFRQLTLFDHNTAATQIACPLRRRSTC